MKILVWGSGQLYSSDLWEGYFSKFAREIGLDQEYDTFDQL